MCMSLCMCPIFIVCVCSICKHAHSPKSIWEAKWGIRFFFCHLWAYKDQWQTGIEWCEHSQLSSNKISLYFLFHLSCYKQVPLYSLFSILPHTLLRGWDISISNSPQSSSDVMSHAFKCETVVIYIRHISERNTCQISFV